MADLAGLIERTLRFFIGGKSAHQIHEIDVRVSDTGDGLIISKEDAKRHKLRPDFPYPGIILPNGLYRIAFIRGVRKDG